MNKLKTAEPLTREQYLKKFSQAVRWRLPPQESEEAIADYRELIYQPERDRGKLVEELGEPVQAAHLLTDVKTYRRWLKVFAVLAFGLFLLAKWNWTGWSDVHLSFAEQWWYPVWVMAVGLALSLYWFRRHGQKNGPMSKWLMLSLVVVLALGAGVLAWEWRVMDAEFLECVAAEPFRGPLHKQIWVLGDLLMYGGAACALAALAGLVLAKCYDRRWLALYILGLTVAALCGFMTFQLKGMSLEYLEANMIQAYLFSRLIPIGAAGLIGTGVALC